MNNIIQPLLDAIRQIVREELSNTSSEDKWLTTEELMEYLGVSRSWVSRNMKDIPHTKSPLRFKKSEVDGWMAAQQEGKVINIAPVRKKERKYIVT